MTVHGLDRATAATASRQVFAGLSLESRYLRFHTGMPVLPARMWRQLDRVDGVIHAALGARIDDLWVGIVRLIRTAPGEAEISIAVADRWQGRGIGRRLVEAAGERAAALGHRRLHANVLAENRRALVLLRSVFEVEGATAECGEVSLALAVRGATSVAPRIAS